MPAVSPEDIAIVTVNWNQLGETRRCLASLPVDDPGWHAFVVDNGSRPDQRATPATIANVRCTILQSDTNLGSAGGYNLALRECARQGYRQAMLLNNDAVLLRGALDPLRGMITGDIGAVCPMVIDEGSGRVWSVGGGINWRHGFSSAHFHGMKPSEVPQESRQCEFGTAACMLLSVEALRLVGGFDETYFAYWEETDWCVRVTRAGFRIVTCPSSRVIHRGGASSTATTRLFLMLRGCLLFMRRNATRRQMLTFLPTFVWWTVPVWSARPFLEDPTGTLWAIYKAIVWHLKRRQLPPPRIDFHGSEIGATHEI